MRELTVPGKGATPDDGAELCKGADADGGCRSWVCWKLRCHALPFVLLVEPMRARLILSFKKHDWRGTIRQYATRLNSHFLAGFGVAADTFAFAAHLKASE